MVFTNPRISHAIHQHGRNVELKAEPIHGTADYGIDLTTDTASHYSGRSLLMRYVFSHYAHPELLDLNDPLTLQLMGFDVTGYYEPYLEHILPGLSVEFRSHKDREVLTYFTRIGEEELYRSTKITSVGDIILSPGDQLLEMYYEGDKVFALIVHADSDHPTKVDITKKLNTLSTWLTYFRFEELKPYIPLLFGEQFTMTRPYHLEYDMQDIYSTNPTLHLRAKTEPFKALQMPERLVRNTDTGRIMWKRRCHVETQGMRTSLEGGYYHQLYYDLLNEAMISIDNAKEKALLGRVEWSDAAIFIDKLCVWEHDGKWYTDQPKLEGLPNITYTIDEGVIRSTLDQGGLKPLGEFLFPDPSIVEG